MTRPAIAILDDYQDVALSCADWSGLAKRAKIKAFQDPWTGGEDQIVRALEPFDIVVLMRERTPFPASLIARLPNLRLIALTGFRTTTLDVAPCTERGILITHTTQNPSTAAAELAFALILACARGLPRAFANMAAGGWEEMPMGVPLIGKRLGILGLGHLGSQVAQFGQAFKMDVVAWADDLTPESAAAHHVRMVDKAELFATSDVVTLHLVLSYPRSAGIVGRKELMAMKPGAIFINAARAGLVDQEALMDVLKAGRITAGLDVYDVEPLPADHPLRKMPNVVLTPHLGYVVEDVFEYYYRDIVEDIEAYLDGRPMRILNPDALQVRRK